MLINNEKSKFYFGSIPDSQKKQNNKSIIFIYNGFSNFLVS
jgi:hypothetical protein